ncbi:Pimeloyl-ACP methyl ester carboxylesterase [Noviherbaspirillum humi]|uniref:Pimeloyl-ACP methyl ester carboxylesterase n=1 Tax=Noviherbaspirillum humi TaxID=1688639 RepID=A0A239DBL9_9BURK|nr:alpha/beta hydrolase [Noviherbaspirillum humi]SNS29512.1 Pimeloyl-ACP methyl ester carboxylesterase [Noviherbaspirillum humi]
MDRPVLQFVHANSYPAGTYHQFFSHLRRHFEIQALDMHAHDPRYPVQNGWSALARELLDDMAERQAAMQTPQPVILVGHSMGGMLSLMAAKARPELVRCVVLLDSPVVAGWRALLLRFAKRGGLDRRFPPAKASQGRRNVFPDAETAYRHYAAKPMFAAWDQNVLRDYIAHGLKPHPQGVTLRFTRETENMVYRTLPDHLGAITRRGFPVPVGFIGGLDSAECRQAGLAATRKLVGRHFQQVPGGHLFPMESPAAAANAVHAMIRSLLGV